MTHSIADFRNKPVEMILLHPITKEPFENSATKGKVNFLIVNQDSRKFYNAKFDAQQKLRGIFEQTKALPTPEQQREATFSMVASLVVGWNDEAIEFLKDELGEDAAYSVDNAYKLLSNEDYFWIVKQIEDFIARETHFFQRQ